MAEQRTLYDVKAALADKYTHLAKICGSKPKRAAYLYRARKYRLQAMQVARDQK